ncbi:hypothetical protein [Pseudomonas sp. S3E12]|uniref:hypothetical protein n=1 Tax=Pseudomonas sp. S3E12 TaxID=1873126 RepID=UPI00114C884E|nr:hypothetical protein [Pseudomonas sp. S3E12]
MFEDIEIQVKTVSQSFQSLKSLFGEEFEADDLKHLFSAIKNNLLSFERNIDIGDTDEALKNAKLTSILGQELAEKAQEIPNDRIKKAGKLESWKASRFRLRNSKQIYQKQICTN